MPAGVSSVSRSMPSSRIDAGTSRLAPRSRSKVPRSTLANAPLVWTSALSRALTVCADGLDSITGIDVPARTVTPSVGAGRVRPTAGGGGSPAPSVTTSIESGTSDGTRCSWASLPHPVMAAASSEALNSLMRMVCCTGSPLPGSCLPASFDADRQYRIAIPAGVCVSWQRGVGSTSAPCWNAAGERAGQQGMLETGRGNPPMGDGASVRDTSISDAILCSAAATCFARTALMRLVAAGGWQCPSSGVPRTAGRTRD